MPATPFDAKGLLLESVFGEDPVIMIEHRSLYAMKNRVPSRPYRVRFGHAAVRRAGEHITLVAVGAMVPFALRVADLLAEHKVRAEVVDLRTVSPLDTESVCKSVEKTGRIAVLDPAWRSFGVSAEIIALRADPIRIGYPDSHTPMSAPLEAIYYPTEADAVAQLRALVR